MIDTLLVWFGCLLVSVIFLLIKVVDAKFIVASIWCCCCVTVNAFIISISSIILPPNDSITLPPLLLNPLYQHQHFSHYLYNYYHQSTTYTKLIVYLARIFWYSCLIFMSRIVLLCCGVSLFVINKSGFFVG